MKILQTIAGFGAKSGGTSTCTYDLLNAQGKLRGGLDDTGRKGHFGQTDGQGRTMDKGFAQRWDKFLRLFIQHEQVSRSVGL